MDPPRRMSTASSSGESTPILSNFNSSTSLILVHDEDEPSSPYDFPDDDEEVPQSPDFEIRRSFSPPMAPSLVFLYLLSPYLKLGAMFLPNTQLPLKYGIPPLIIFAVLSAFSRQIWYMLARYMSKADLEDIVLDAFAPGRGSTKERLRSWLRTIVRGGTGLLCVLLAFIYLRESVHIILPLLPEDFIFPPRSVLTVVSALVLLPLVSAPSLCSKRVVYTTWISIATYLIWFGCVAVAHAHGTLEVNPSWLRMGTFWQGFTTTAFAFTSSSTLPLYASLKAGSPPSAISKTSASRSFRTLSLISVAVAVAFTMPLVFFTARPSAIDDSSLIHLQPAIAILNSLTLLLAIPSVLVTTPSLPIPERIRRSTTIPLSKYLIFALVTALSLVPTSIASILSDILLACACGSTFFLPALIHITTHFFQRPISILMPQLPSTSTREPLPAATDELLQRKERALQKRQFRKRLVWDIGVWVLLLPVGGGGFVWGVGRLAGKW